MQLRHGSLFSGIGGFDLAAQWSGWENVFHCEWKEFNQKILKYYWPEAITYNDITKSDFTIHRGKIDVLTGGFPCQPYSVAGKRKGKEDDRHLWPEMLRAIREIQPSWVVGENVGGLVSWNGGLVFDEVQTELEAEGYEVQPFILPACAVNAPHRRDRIWFIAYSNLGTKRPPRENSEIKSDGGENNDEQSSRGIEGQQYTGCGELLRTFTNSKSQGGERLPIGKNEESTLYGINGKNGDSGLHERNIRSAWEIFPTQSPLCNGNDGLSSRLDGITFPKWRNESIMSGGNAIVPQVAFEIFKIINKMCEF